MLLDFNFSTTRLLKCKSGSIKKCDWLKKIISWVCLVGSLLNYFTLFDPFTNFC